MKLAVALKATSQKLNLELKQQTRFYYLIELCELNKDMNEEWIRVETSYVEIELLCNEHHEAASSNQATHQKELCREGRHHKIDSEVKIDEREPGGKRY